MRATRKEKALRLLDRLTKGPSLTKGDHLEKDLNAERQVRNWLESWIIDDVCDLVPELQSRSELRRTLVEEMNREKH